MRAAQSLGLEQTAGPGLAFAITDVPRVPTFSLKVTFEADTKAANVLFRVDNEPWRTGNAKLIPTGESADSLIRTFIEPIPHAVAQALIMNDTPEQIAQYISSRTQLISAMTKSEFNVVKYSNYNIDFGDFTPTFGIKIHVGPRGDVTEGFHVLLRRMKYVPAIAAPEVHRRVVAEALTPQDRVRAPPGDEEDEKGPPFEVTSSSKKTTAIGRNCTSLSIIPSTRLILRPARFANSSS